SERLRPGDLGLDEVDDAVFAQWVWTAEVLLRHPVDDLPRPLTVDSLAHAPADVRHEVGLARVGDRERDTRVTIQVARLARARAGQDRQPLVFDTHPDRDAVRGAV